MTFCERWRAMVSDYGVLEDGHEVFDLEKDDVDLAIPAMRALTIGKPDTCAIVLPLHVGSSSELFNDRGTTDPGVICELPFTLGDVEFELKPSLLSSSQYETVLGSIESPFRHDPTNSSGFTLHKELPINDMFWGEPHAVPSPLSKLTFGDSIVKNFLWFSSMGLGVTIIKMGIESLEEDAANIYPTLNLIWQDCIAAIQK